MRKGKLPDGPLRQIIQMESETYTVTRHTKSISEIGDVTETDVTHKENIHVFKASRSPVQLPHGETFDESLTGLALPDADLQDGDEITYNNTDFELTVTEVPDTASTKYISLDLERTDTQ